MSAKRLMMLGASLAQLPGILAAQAMGYEVVTCDYLPDAPGHELADQFEWVSTFDRERVLSAAQKHKVDGIMTMGTDQPVLTAAWVAEKLCLPTLLTVTQALQLTDKREMKRLFSDHQLPSVKSVLYQPAPPELSNDGALVLDNFPFPAVIKPVDSQGQRGVFFVTSPHEVFRHASDVLKHSRATEFLVESYYPSDEMTVSGWVYEGKSHLLTLTDRITFQSREQLGICLSHEWPSRFQVKYGDEIEQLTQNIVQAAGIQNGPIYLQLLLGDQGLMINEIAGRIGGAFESQFIPRISGFDPVQTQILLSLGEEVPKSVWDQLTAYDFRGQAGALSVQLFFVHPCTLRNLTPVSELLKCPGVIDAGYHLSAGLTIASIDNATARVGYCIVEAPDPMTLEERLANLYRVLRLEDLDGVNQTIHRPLFTGGFL